MEDYVPEQKEVIRKSNRYISNVTRKYESGYKLDDPMKLLL